MGHQSLLISILHLAVGLGTRLPREMHPNLVPWATAAMHGVSCQPSDMLAARKSNSVSACRCPGPLCEKFTHTLHVAWPSSTLIMSVLGFDVRMHNTGQACDGIMV